jgi:hypothetical protein
MSNMSQGERVPVGWGASFANFGGTSAGYGASNLAAGRPVQRLSIVSPLVGETMDDAVPTGWRFGDRALQMHVAMTWPG